MRSTWRMSREPKPPNHPSCVILVSMRRLTPSFLVAYSFTVTLAFILTVYIGFIRPVHGASRVTDFDLIRAHRIDLVEPDGTERLILSNRSDYPGSFFHNHEVARPDRRDSAGLLMMNDEGTEDGGFIWGGLTTDGKPMSFTHLSFDQYEQDQTLNLESSLSDGQHFTGIHMSDVPDYPITPQMMDAFTRVKAMPDTPARAAALATLLKHYPQGHQRLALDRDATNNVGLTLRDPSGNPRLKILVAPDGTPSIQFLDPAGHPTRTITSSPLTK
jgi:hypothetical protein